MLNLIIASTIFIRDDDDDDDGDDIPTLLKMELEGGESY